MKLFQSYRYLVISLVLGAFAHAAETQWYQDPFRIKAGDKLLDTFEFDAGGHAAPFLADLDGDGLRDLVVGSINGKFRFFKNVGRDSAPQFGAQSSWLMAGLNGDEPAEVPNFCCVASGPQLVDIDRDGILDLTSGSYHPGAIYYFKGLGNGKYAARQMLTDRSGLPIFANPEKNVYEYENMDSYTSNIAWTDWNLDGYLDLIIGDFKGELLVRLNASGPEYQSDYSIHPVPIKGQPVFLKKDSQKINNISIDGQNAIPGYHSAPSVADWDGDGLWDILVGSKTGAVYWLRNSGSPGKPVFSTREELLGPGTGYQWLEANAVSDRGVRTQIQAVDYNSDGKMDLLVGDWSVIQEERPGLTEQERAEMRTLKAELAELDKLVGFKNANIHYRIVDYSNSQLRQDGAALYSERAAVIEKQLRKFLRIHALPVQQTRAGRSESDVRFSGHVWVFLRK